MEFRFGETSVPFVALRRKKFLNEQLYNDIIPDGDMDVASNVPKKLEKNKSNSGSTKLWTTSLLEPGKKEREGVDPKFRRRNEVSGGRNVSASIEGKFESSASWYPPPFLSK